jgi:hypothetical protein
MAMPLSLVVDHQERVQPIIKSAFCPPIPCDGNFHRWRLSDFHRNASPFERNNHHLYRLKRHSKDEHYLHSLPLVSLRALRFNISLRAILSSTSRAWFAD